MLTWQVPICGTILSAHHSHRFRFEQFRNLTPNKQNIHRLSPLPVVPDGMFSAKLAARVWICPKHLLSVLHGRQFAAPFRTYFAVATLKEKGRE
jgi:hypothetical protein